MSSYVNKKTRVFRTIADNKLEPKRIDGRMKAYPSATDARAWCAITEDQRQYILELVRCGGDKFTYNGKLLSVDALLKLFLASQAHVSLPTDNEKTQNWVNDTRFADADRPDDGILRVKDLKAFGEDAELASKQLGGAESLLQDARRRSQLEAGRNGSGWPEAGGSSGSDSPRDFNTAIDHLEQFGGSDTFSGESGDGNEYALHSDMMRERDLSLTTMEHVCICTELLSSIAPPLTSCKSTCKSKCSRMDDNKNSLMEVKLLRQNTELTHRLYAEKECTRRKIENLHGILNRLNKDLCMERQRNENLVNRYVNQSRTVETLQMERKRELNGYTRQKKLVSKLGCCSCVSAHSPVTIYETVPHIYADVRIYEDDILTDLNPVCNCNESSISLNEHSID